MTTALDNPAWSALTTCQAHLSYGGSHVRRYPNDVAQIGAIGANDPVVSDEIASVVPQGEWLSFPATLDQAAALVPPTLRVTLRGTLVQMVGSTRIAVPEIDATPELLSEADADQMLRLADLARPGPFRTHTHTLGTYLGIRIGGRLVAMADERMHLPGYREVSGVSTLPDFRNRGYARLLVAHLSNRIREEGLTPFLHVEESNLRALALYSKLGFVERRRLPLLVVTRA